MALRLSERLRLRRRTCGRYDATLLKALVCGIGAHHEPPDCSSSKSGSRTPDSANTPAETLQSGPNRASRSPSSVHDALCVLRLPVLCSYGGHYGPTFAAYFLEQNTKVANGSVSGLPINLKVLGVGDGLTVCASLTVNLTNSS